MNLFWWTIAELRAECRKRGLPDSGNKAELIQHLKGSVNPAFWTEQYGISEREWRVSINKYERLGSEVLPPYAFLTTSWDLIKQDKLQEAVDKLSSHYRIKSSPVVRREAKDGEAGEYKEGQIILYPRAFAKDKPDLGYVVYHEFAHHLQEHKYPFTGKVAALQEKGRQYTFVQRELFADSFTKGCMQRLGFVFVTKKDQ